ncbi:MAG: PKD domain-containing protein, partial [bacterium]
MRTLSALRILAGAALVACLPAACVATVNLGIFLQSQSPDGRTVEINGGIWSEDASILGWVYEWGDGSASTGWFPMIHRYGWPGDFTVTVTGYDDTGDTAVAQLVVTVPEPDPTDVVFVQIEPGAWSIKDTDSLELRLHAFDADWQPLEMAGRRVEVWYPGAGDFVDVAVRDTVLMVTAKSLGERDYAWSSIYVYVDGAPGMDAMNLMTNKHPGDFTHRHIWWVGSYLPDTFFVACSLDIDEYCHINDL